MLNITGGTDLGIFEAQDAANIIRDATSDDANIIFGTSIDENMSDEIRVSVIATGIDDDSNPIVNTPGLNTSIKSNNQVVEPTKPVSPSLDNSQNNDTVDRRFANVEKKDFEPFKTSEDDDNGDNSNDDIPPFNFKYRNN